MIAFRFCPATRHIFTMETKRCTKCGETKPLNQMKQSRGQASSWCKACAAAGTRRYVAQHHEDVLTKKRAAHHANRDHNLARAAEYRTAHREELRAKARAYAATRMPTLVAKARARRHANPDPLRAYHRAWNKAHPEVMQALRERRRARERGSSGTFTRAEWQALVTQYGRRCLMCKRQEPDITLTVDHIVPLAQGGSNDITNLQPLCSTCNKSKGAKILDLRP